MGKEKLKINHLKNRKGITLIALVVTIIVLLILAGISINMIVGDNGIITKVSKEKEKAEIEEIIERAKVDIIGEQTGNRGKLTKEQFITILREYFEETTIPAEEDLPEDMSTANQILTAKKEYGSFEIEISEIWGGKFAQNANNNQEKEIKINVTHVYTENPVLADGVKVSSITEGAPIPVGFYYVGGTKDTGIVISDNSQDLNVGVSAELKGNQYVWVPVLQNQTIKIKIETIEPISELIIEDPRYELITTDKDGNELSAVGTTSYEVEINPTTNGTYFVTVTTGGETFFEGLDVLSLYAGHYESRKCIFA